MNAPTPQSRITLRPLATPLPLGFCGLLVATVAFAAVQLRWVPTGAEQVAALTALLFAAPLQFLACLFGFFCRDPVAGTGMGLLSATWAIIGAATLSSTPGSSSAGLGVVLLSSSGALLIPAIAGLAKPVAAAVMAVAAGRFAVTGVAEITGSVAWLTAAGVVGLVLAGLALYAAAAFELEGVRHRAVLPLGRTGSARQAVTGDTPGQTSELVREPGVRQQL